MSVGGSIDATNTERGARAARPVAPQSPNRHADYTPAELYETADAPHTHGLLWKTPAWIAIAAALILSAVGIVAIATTEPGLALRQAVFLGIAVVAALASATFHYRRLRKLSWVLGAIAIALLIFVLLPFVPEAIVRPRKGARRWIDLGITEFQPSELAKIAYVLVIADWLSRMRTYRSWLGFLVPFGLTVVPFALVLREPDLGTALLFFPALLAMLFAAGARWRHVLTVVILGLSLGPIAYLTPGVLQPHQVDRVEAMVAQLRGDTSLDDDEGFQGAKAKIIVGSGGMTGVGRDHAAALVKFNALPEEHNDMIFAVVCCRWGMLGGLALWGTYLAFAAGAILVALRCHDAFGRLVAIGLAAIVFVQMTINTGMTIGLLPITGMTLPFVSYGGSSLVATWIMAGLILNVGLRRPRRGEPEPFVFND